MIITCPWCLKKFEVDEALVPASGKMLQCGSCSKKWFFKKERQLPEKKNPIQRISIDSNLEKVPKETEDIIKEAETIIKKNVKKNKKNKIPVLNFLLVLIISFVALVVLLDTFKFKLNELIPGFIFFLENLYNTLLDSFLFIKDLFK